MKTRRGWQAALLLLFLPPPVRADDVQGDLVELVDATGQRLPRFEASGVAYFKGSPIVVDDTVNALFVFDGQGRLSYRLEVDGFPTARARFEDIAIDPSTGTGFVDNDQDDTGVPSKLRRAELTGMLQELKP